MNLDIEKKTGTVTTINLETLNCLSFNIKENSYNIITIDTICIDQLNKLVTDFLARIYVQRKSSEIRIVYFQIIKRGGDAGLEAASINVSADDFTLNIQVTGIDQVQLDWGTQAEIDQWLPID